MLDTRARVEALVADGGSWLRFRDPVLVLAATRPSDVRPTLRELERLTRDRQLHAVGWVSFDAGAAFDLAIHPGRAEWPLAWFGLFDASSVRRLNTLDEQGDYRLGPVEPRLDRATFRDRFNRIREHIAAGDSYQANFTFQLRAEFEGDPRALFRDLAAAQQGLYSTFISIDDIAICSVSPELFFELDGLDIVARPMKGTASRGLTPEADAAARERLTSSEKERAENVMIVDMMRNDLGRIADVGSVTVSDLFRAERYPTVWQMTSNVRARTRATLEGIFAALHPSASVTGAPKVRTLELLAALEQGPRGIYTGAIGHVPPDGNARFNVAIRTAIVDLASASVQFGVGSGIVWDSDADAEYDECLLKGAVLGRTPITFELLETLKWTPEAGFDLLERHLARMGASADYFGIRWSAADARDALTRSVAAGSGQSKVRLLLDRNGTLRTEVAPLGSTAGHVRVTVAPTPVSSGDVWLYHKTTHRTAYDRARNACPGVDDVLLWNERGEVTESTIANVVVEVDGERVTPPVSSGLLAGTFRAELLEQGAVKERVVRVDELRGRPLWLVNSVRGWRAADLVD